MAKQTNGTTDEMPSIDTLVANEKKARAAFNENGEGWRPETDKGKQVRQALRDARKALKLATGTETAREAYTKAGHKPVYAARGKKE